MVDVIEDVSKLTTIPVKSLNSLNDKVIYCIVDSVKESCLENLETTELYLGIGTLVIKYVDKSLKYKFIPSNKLNEKMNDLFNKKLNSLENVLETSLVDKIVNTYKDLI